MKIVDQPKYQVIQVVASLKRKEIKNLYHLTFKGALINGLSAHQDKPRTIFQLNGNNQRTAQLIIADNLDDRLGLPHAKADRTLLMMAGDGP